MKLVRSWLVGVSDGAPISSLDGKGTVLLESEEWTPPLWLGGFLESHLRSVRVDSVDMQMLFARREEVEEGVLAFGRGMETYEPIRKPVLESKEALLEVIRKGPAHIQLFNPEMQLHVGDHYEQGLRVDLKLVKRVRDDLLVKDQIPNNDAARNLFSQARITMEDGYSQADWKHALIGWPPGSGPQA